MVSLLSDPVQSVLTDIARLCVWLAGLAVVFMPLERLLAVRASRFPRKGIGADLGWYFINSLLPAALLSVPMALLAWVAHSVVPHSVHSAIAGMPFWARALAALAAGEIGVYWGHRWSHEIPALWRFHALHHSAETVDFMVNTRAHPVDMVFGRLSGAVPIHILGLAGPEDVAGATMPLLITLFCMVWSFFIHANLRLDFGPLAWAISTPRFHHWHHTLAPPVNRNYASMLPVLDVVFGTFHLPKGEWPRAYGIAEPMPGGLFEQLAQPLAPRTPPIEA